MRKFKVLTVIMLLAVGCASAQADWINYKIDQRLSARLPSQPKQLDDNSVMSVTKDSSVFVITVVDFLKAANLDSTALASLAPTTDFANGLKTGMLSQMQGFTLGDVNIGKWNGYTSYSMEGGNAARKIKLYTFMVLISNYLYGLSLVMPEQNSAAIKDAFFSSLEMNGAKPPGAITY